MIGSSIVGWDINEENKRIVFLEHMYRCDGREDPSHPKHGTYTGLWQNFCLNEAGEAMRNQWFDRIEGLDRYLQELKEAEESTQNVFIPGFDD